jgi:hypothetical protein
MQFAISSTITGIAIRDQRASSSITEFISMKPG